jgi:hypothetical protein
MDNLFVRTLSRSLGILAIVLAIARCSGDPAATAELTSARSTAQNDAAPPAVSSAGPVLPCAAPAPVLCSIANAYTLCFTRPGDSARKSECLWDWHDDSPICASGFTAGTHCQAPATRIEDVCHLSVMATVDYACFCNQDRMTECHRFDEL